MEINCVNVTEPSSQLKQLLENKMISQRLFNKLYKNELMIKAEEDCSFLDLLYKSSHSSNYKVIIGEVLNTYSKKLSNSTLC